MVRFLVCVYIGIGIGILYFFPISSVLHFLKGNSQLYEYQLIKYISRVEVAQLQSNYAEKTIITVQFMKGNS